MPTKTKNNIIQGESDNSIITVQQRLVVPANREQEAISISRKEFHYLRDKIKGISCKANTFSNFGFTSLGIFGSALIALIPFIKEKDKILISISSGIILLTLFAMIVFFTLSKKTETKDLEVKTDTIKQMNIIEDRFYDLNL